MNYIEKDVQKRIEEHYAIAESLGYEIVGVFCQGSWNYNSELCDAESDIDSKCLVLPSFEDFCLGKPMISTTYVTDNNEHIDIKDLRLYAKCFKKQNINFVEILFTKYKKINPKYQDIFNKLIERREEIVKYNVKAAVNCAVGMAYEKRKALCHPYPALIDKIEKYGYDGKQLSHILRIEYFLERYLRGAHYEACIHVDDEFAKYLLRVKRNKEYTLDEANNLADQVIDRLETIRWKYADLINHLEINESVSQLLDDVSIECMKINFLSYLEN